MRKMRTYRECLIEDLADRDEAIGYLQAILDDYYVFGSTTIVRDALETVVEAQGGVSQLAKQNDIDPKAFSRMLTHEKTPLIDAIGTVLNVLGHQLSIKPIDPEDMNLQTCTDALAGNTAV